MLKLNRQRFLLTAAVLLWIALIGPVGNLANHCSTDDGKLPVNIDKRNALSDFVAGRAMTYTNGTRPGGWTFELSYNTENLTYRIVDTNTGGIVEQRPIPDRFLFQPDQPTLCRYVQGDIQ